MCAPVCRQRTTPAQAARSAQRPRRPPALAARVAESLPLEHCRQRSHAYGALCPSANNASGGITSASPLPGLLISWPPPPPNRSEAKGPRVAPCGQTSAQCHELITHPLAPREARSVHAILVGCFAKLVRLVILAGWAYTVRATSPVNASVIVHWASLTGPVVPGLPKIGRALTPQAVTVPPCNNSLCFGDNSVAHSIHGQSLASAPAMTCLPLSTCVQFATRAGCGPCAATSTGDPTKPTAHVHACLRARTASTANGVGLPACNSKHGGCRQRSPAASGGKRGNNTHTHPKFNHNIQQSCIAAKIMHRWHADMCCACAKVPPGAYGFLSLRSNVCT